MPGSYESGAGNNYRTAGGQAVRNHNFSIGFGLREHRIQTQHVSGSRSA